MIPDHNVLSTQYRTSSDQNTDSNGEFSAAENEKDLMVSIQELQLQLSMNRGQSEGSQETTSSSKKDARRRLIMISNRLPISVKRDEATNEYAFSMSSGGLVTALNGIRDEVPFIWIGWLGEEIRQEDQARVRDQLAKEFNCIPVFLTKEVAELYYNDFSNDILWPIFHYVPLPMFRPNAEKKFDFRPWETYKYANNRFAQTVNQVYRKGDFIWIHDYHLMMLPTLLRKRNPSATIAWFLHTPFPSSDVYRMLPVGKQILEGLLGADLLGFHTYDYARHFLSACSRIPETNSSPKGIEYDDHFSAIGVYPIGIDPDHFVRILNADRTQNRIQELCTTFAGKRIIIGVDRMDYIKGIPHRMLSMERFLSMYPEHREKVILIQVAVPSRTGVLEYQNLAANVNEMVGRINGRFGTLDYTPIHYIHHSVQPHELVALYNIADVCLVTSLRDGMNLVSHEYVMCQVRECEKRREGPGVLVLSEFAGSAQSLSGAIRVNPWNTHDIATALDQALKLPAKEREYRQMNLLRYVRTHSASSWGKTFLSDLESMQSLSKPDKKLKKLPFMDVVHAYDTSSRRLLILNYDSSLSSDGQQENRMNTPPKPSVKRFLQTLYEDPKNTILLMTSHRRDFLTSWLGDTRVGMAAESGYYYRLPQEKEWQKIGETEDASWKRVVQPIMQYFTERTPGSLVETTDSSLTWHYGRTDSIFGPMQARDLQLNLEDLLCNLPLEVLQRRDCVEVRLPEVSKRVLLDGCMEQAGLSVENNTPQTDRFDFMLCIGTGADDEDVFSYFRKFYDVVSKKDDNGRSSLLTPTFSTNVIVPERLSRTASGTMILSNSMMGIDQRSASSTSCSIVKMPASQNQQNSKEKYEQDSIPPQEHHHVGAFSARASIFTCHIGSCSKTKATYYLERSTDAMLLLRSLASRSRKIGQEVELSPP
ncbi:hypothetical protein ABG067_004645 [Albugo candida]